jgi:hypothetical protein
MKVMEVAPFCFRFKTITDKKKSYELLVNFLKDNNWLNARCDKMEPLTSCHTDESGACHVLLANDILSEEFIEDVDKMFDNLIADKDIEWIKVGFHPATEGIIYNNVDKYPQYQTISIQDMTKGDMMVVFKRK